MAEFYDKPLDYAKANGELDKWRDSLHETRRCAETIKNLITENHDGFHLATDKIIEGAVKEFGTEHVTLALAATIQRKDWDGRFSHKNKEWAKSIDVPKDGYHNEINVNAHSTLLDGVVSDYRKYLLVLEKNHSEKKDISESAEKSAEHSQGGTEMAEHTTTFEVSSMLKIEDSTNVRALANIVVNGEIAVNNVKVVQSEKGLFTAMPSKKVGTDYVDMALTTTKEAYADLNKAVLSSYDTLSKSGEKTLKNDLALDKTKAVTSDIRVSLHEVSHESVKAAGQVRIDNCFVINDVKLIKPKDPEKPLFVSMPSYPNRKGTYTDIALPITTAMHKALDDAVQSAFRNIEKVEYKGVKYAELGDKSEIVSTPKLNNNFAKDLMAQLDKAGITYQARIGSNSGTVISVNAADKPRLDKVHKNLVKALNPEKEKQAAPKQDDKPKPKHAKR